MNAIRNIIELKSKRINIDLPEDYNSYKEVNNKCDEIINYYNSIPLFEKCNNYDNFLMKKIMLLHEI